MQAIRKRKVYHMRLFNPVATILTLAAVGVVAAVFTVLPAAPVQAQTDAVWSATLTVSDLGNSTYGCDNGVEGKECNSTSVMSDDDVEIGYPAAAYTVTGISLSGGYLSVHFDKDVNTALSGLSLRAGSTELAFPDPDEYLLGDDIAYWENTGLSWSDGDTVSLSIVVTGAITDLAAAPAATTAVVTWKNITPWKEGDRPWRGHYISWKIADTEGPIVGDALFNLTIKGAPEGGASGKTTIRNLKPGTAYDLTVSDRYVHTYATASSRGEATIRFTTESAETAEPAPFKFIVLIHVKDGQGESKEERRLEVDRPFDANTMAYAAMAPPRFTHAAIAHNPDLYDVTLASNQEVEIDRTHVPLNKGINVITASVTPKGSQGSQTYTFTILRPGDGNTVIEAPRNVTSSMQENGDLLITWDDPANAEADGVDVTGWLVQWRPKGVQGDDWSDEPFILVHPKGDDNRLTVAKGDRIASSNPDVGFQARVQAYDAEAKRLGPGASSPVGGL